LWCLGCCVRRSRSTATATATATVYIKRVAVRLAGGGDLEGVTAGKPDCYGFATNTDFELNI
jgi:hypothetical protein